MISFFKYKSVKYIRREVSVKIYRNIYILSSILLLFSSLCHSYQALPTGQRQEDKTRDFFFVNNHNDREAAIS